MPRRLARPATPLDDASSSNRTQLARARSALPEVWALIRPRRAVLGLGLALILVGRAAALVLPVSTKWLIDDVLGQNRPDLLLPLVGFVVAMAVVQGAVGLFTARLFGRASQDLIVELRCRVQQHLLRLPVAYHDVSKSGALVQRTMVDVQGIQNVLGSNFVQFIGAVMTSFLALVVMLRISVAMTLLAAAALLVFAVLVTRITGRLRPIARRRARMQADVAGRLAEAFGGIRVLKGYRGEAREQEVFRRGAEGVRDVTLETVWLSSALSSASALMLGIVGGGMMLLGGRFILRGALSLGSFVTYSALMSFLAAPITQIVSLGQLLTEALAGLDRTREILDERPEDEDPRRTERMGRIRGAVAFEDVRFAYSPDQPVLRGVRFEAQPGSVTALVGPSGSGKSTAMGLLAAFYVATEGRVLVDGVDVSRVTLGSYRSQLGLVLQETFLFDGTILENVAFARPDASREDVLAACRTARVDEIADKLERGYETVVGERGVLLSGGQKQRISIARALLADPRILLLDEATSNLDSQSEALIQEALSHLFQGRTTFVIAHRLSTIQKADCILVLDRGEIVERGRHEELLARKGRYYAMYTQQHAAAGEPLFADGTREESAARADAPETRTITAEGAS